MSEDFSWTPDYDQIKDGQRVFRGNVFDQNDKLIGPIPMKMNDDNKKVNTVSETEDQEIIPMTWEQIDRLVFPDNQWRIKNLIPLSGFVILASISGEGKSWVALELAKSISTGKNFLDQEIFATIAGKILYIDAENSKSEIQRRGRKLSLKHNDNLLFYPTDKINLNDDEQVEDLFSVIENENIDVVIIDTFRAVSGGLKEEKAEDVRVFFSRFKPLKEKGKCIIFLDHCRKPHNFEGKIPKKEFLFGSQDKTANVEVLIMMKKEGNEISVYQRKNRLGREIDPFNFNFVDHGEEDDSEMSLAYGGIIDEEDSKKDTAKDYILTILKEKDFTTPQIVEIMAKDKKIAGRNTRDALKELREAKLIDRRKIGHRDEYFLTREDEMNEKFKNA